MELFFGCMPNESDCKNAKTMECALQDRINFYNCGVEFEKGLVIDAGQLYEKIDDDNIPKEQMIHKVVQCMTSRQIRC